jgi:hypothetical protein
MSVNPKLKNGPHWEFDDLERALWWRIFNWSYMLTPFATKWKGFKYSNTNYHQLTFIYVFGWRVAILRRRL